MIKKYQTNSKETKMNNNISLKASNRKLWPTLFIWPTLIITIVIFVLYMFPFPEDESRISIASKDNTTAIKAAIDAYLLNTNEFPLMLNDLVEDPGIDGWAGPYLKPSQLNDANGTPISYIRSSNPRPNNYTIKSYGKDGQPGGRGYNEDIYND